MSASHVNAAAPATSKHSDNAPWWMASLVCPSCRAPLPDPARCDACGLEYDADGETPRLLNPAVGRTVSFRFDAGRSYMPDEELLRVFRAPPRLARKDDLPYHVDAAHALVVDQLPAGTRVLEIGCGGGQSRRWYVGRGHHYVGTDISKTRVHDWLQEHGGPDLLCDAHFLPFADESFDLVYCAAVFEHLACPVLAAQEVLRVLKPGGLFLGNASFLEPWHDNSYFHFSPLGAVEMLTAAGFAPQHVWPGHRYSGYEAIFMPLRAAPLRWLGKSIGHVYRLQNAGLAAARRAAGRPAVAPIMAEGTLAGAIDWIARKPSALSGDQAAGSSD